MYKHYGMDVGTQNKVPVLLGTFNDAIQKMIEKDSKSEIQLSELQNR